MRMRSNLWGQLRAPHVENPGKNSKAVEKPPVWVPAEHVSTFRIEFCCLDYPEVAHILRQRQKCQPSFSQRDFFYPHAKNAGAIRRANSGPAHVAHGTVGGGREDSRGLAPARKVGRRSFSKLQNTLVGRNTTPIPGTLRFHQTSKNRKMIDQRACFHADENNRNAAW